MLLLLLLDVINEPSIKEYTHLQIYCIHGDYHFQKERQVGVSSARIPICKRVMMP